MAFRCLVSLFPNVSPIFQPSGTITSTANERSRLHRKPLPWRMLSLDMLMYLVYVIYASVCLILCWRSYRSRDSVSKPPLSLFPGTMIKLLQCTWNAAIPLWYMLLPPTVPEREELMERDEDGSRRPKKRSDSAETSGVWEIFLMGMDICELLIAYYCIWG